MVGGRGRGSVREVIGVAGSTGYIGGLLSRHLCEEGHEVRALARRPERADDLREAGCEVRQADALDPKTLGPALEGTEVAYYLVHSMGRGSDGDFVERDHRAAENFAAAAGAGGGQRDVFPRGVGGGAQD